MVERGFILLKSFTSHVCACFLFSPVSLHLEINCEPATNEVLTHERQDNLPNVQTIASKCFIHHAFYSSPELVFVWKCVKCVFGLQLQPHHSMRTVFGSSKVFVSCKIIDGDSSLCRVIYCLPTHQMLSLCQKFLALPPLYNRGKLLLLQVI